MPYSGVDLGGLISEVFLITLAVHPGFYSHLLVDPRSLTSVEEGGNCEASAEVYHICETPLAFNLYFPEN